MARTRGNAEAQDELTQEAVELTLMIASNRAYSKLLGQLPPYTAAGAAGDGDLPQSTLNYMREEWRLWMKLEKMALTCPIAKD